jgi:hypothetical protein
MCIFYETTRINVSSFTYPLFNFNTSQIFSFFFADF